MNTSSLSRITMETMANYRTAAAQVVAASGAGSRRLVNAVDDALQSQVVPRTARLAPVAGERLDDLRGNVNRMVVQGIDQAVERSEQVIATTSDFAVAQVTRVADLMADIDNAIIASGVEAAARFTLPAAQLALAVSSKVAEGATQLADAAGARPVKAAAEKAAKATKRRVAKVAKQAEVEVKAVRRRAAKAVAPVADAPVVKRARRAAKKAVAA
ncbi:MAG: hypothetical protein RJA10_2461 [Pseudomonadota bacterium]|jgi:hypothetical protein